MIDEFGKRCIAWCITATAVVCLVLACLPAHSALPQGGNSSMPGEICYASGNQLWLRNLSTGRTTRLTNEQDKRVTYHLPIWTDHNHILFIRSEKSNTQVGIIDVPSKSIKWFPSLAGADSIGYNSGKIDYVKVAVNKQEGDEVDVYFGTCDPATAKATSKLAYGSLGGVDYHRIYAWPKPSMRVVPIGTSDPSDQVMVYDMASNKSRWVLSEKERCKLFGIVEEFYWLSIFAFATGPNGVLAMYIVGQPGGLCVVKPSVGKVTWISKTAANVGSVVMSHDGRWLAYDRVEETHWTNGECFENRSLWISSTSNPRPWKVCEGWEADFRP